jgi:hypothetical protein
MQTPLEFEQFKEALPLLGIEFAKAKAKEVRNRVKEMRQVLQYPDGGLNVPLSI